MEESRDRRASRSPGPHALPGSRRVVLRRRRAVAGAALVVLLALVGSFALMAALAGSATRHRPRAPLSRSRRAAVRAAPAAPAGGSPGPVQEDEINRRVLAYTSYIALGTAREPEVALTFDDEPGPYTPQVLSVLERMHVKATFFEIGEDVRVFSHCTAALVKAGMVIGDHTEQHPPMALLDRSQQALELDEASDQIQAAGAPQPLLFRPPYGSFDSTTLRLLRAREMVMVLWTVDTSDYQLPGVRRIVESALHGARAGAIILLHDGGGDRSETVAALPRIIDGLRARGYRLVTVPELLRDDPPPVGQPAPVNLSGD